MSGQRSITKVILVLAALLFGARVEAQTASSESQVKAGFVYNFLKFVEWPVSAAVGQRDPFVVVIVGEGATADATELLLESKTIGGKPLEVHRARWDESLAGARAVFVIERDARKLGHVLAAAATAGVLAIGEGDDFTTRGGVIGLVVEDRRIRFDVDTAAAKTAHLRVSSKLLALSRSVRSSADRSGRK